MKPGALSLLVGCVALGACSSRAIIAVLDDDDSTRGGAPTGSEAGTAGAATPSVGAAGEASGGASSVKTGDFDPLFPYPDTNYAEPYRGQFHFSTTSGWMNDVDGLWFAAGVYHLTYQASPYAFAGGSDLHWAHATSSDLLHWQQQPLMLASGVNVDGEAWSGTAVVDLRNSAGLQSGNAPTVVAVYTSTKHGTSLAYSNDQGVSFQSFVGNPVAVGDADYQTNRDPAVVWHAPSQRWVCAYWQDGTTFYTSPDLKTWSKASNIGFGDVVPSFYELPLDGDAKDTRWVLEAGGGGYLVGTFDGQSFVPDAQDARDVDVGPSFFAAHTFFQPTFPDARVVQIAWMKAGAEPTAPWRGSATFPVELGLKTFPSGVKVTRTPIAEIEKLYTARKHWDAQTLPSGGNLLNGIRSKTFDFEIAFSTTKTTASQLTFQVANKTFVYDFAKQTLLGAPLAPLAGQLKIRILVDWGSLEVFANDGELSWTEAFDFTPADASLSVSADGAVDVVSADFREVGRAWPGKSATEAQVVDDVDADYEGAWSTVTDDATFFGGTCHFSTADSAAVDATFTGTRVDWYGLRNTDLGKADVFIDDALAAEAVDCYAAIRAPAQLLSVSNLANTFHTLRVVARGDKNRASTGTALVHDYFVSSVEQ